MVKITAETEEGEIEKDNVALASITFYKFGFLDGYKVRNEKRGRMMSEIKVWERVHKYAKKCFEKRFNSGKDAFPTETKINETNNN